MLARDDRSELIHRSRTRSLQSGVDQHRAVNDILKGGELVDRQKELKKFFKVTDDILNQLFLQLRKSDFMILVSDLDGYIVNTWGEPPFSERAKNVWLDTGANWTEGIKGTNAIGTALIEKQPVSVVGNEHFCRENHFLTCYAAPLYAPTGELLCILDVSGDVAHHHPHTMGMVIAASQACQARLLLHHAENELTLTLSENHTLIREHQQPLLSVDENGIITKLNSHAAHILGATIRDCVGQPLNKWFREETKEILSPEGTSTKTVTMKSEKNEKYREWKVQTISDRRKKMYRALLKPVRANGHSAPENRIADCPRVKKVLDAANAIAQTDATVLILGETGSGKDWIAQTIHRASGRKGPFLAVNCGALPDHLIESELFGYEKGAFTGANREGKTGKFEAADGGTLFLDEIGELPLSSQTVLLRVLEEKLVTRIGGHHPRSVDVRIVAATNRDLSTEIQKGTFRSDLYYRLCEFELKIPPLRERKDLKKLIDHFLGQSADELGSEMTLDEWALQKLLHYHWPGNIRELKQVIRQSCYQTFFVNHSQRITIDEIRLPQGGKNEYLLESQEEKTIERVLEKTKGNISEASRLLGISRTTLYRKINQYGNLKELRSRLKGVHPCS
ncbi:transcriptional regulator of acetoin/glycerol metabolism [Melghirimyces profundicolus]|uniref:Transcriptional regulator of acetoin/glycerol metabolism n=1 Tax=Melghirimyces profundicolus TaxID=1242148 RepID=A0A2T6C0N8_9BACL|nr:sigma-54-dependent Fis family transcriptional regulator [Melghirimyces profundicolus]PTX61879.1 transcriptional regulator of acetoin/glycerol metabolism [Melghirimyces profundicolus]